MKKLLISITLTLAACALILGVGCASMSSYLTPATIDARAVAYAAEAGVVDANSFAGYANLEKAIRLESAVDAAYQVNTLILSQLVDKNKLDYDLLHGAVMSDVGMAQQREEMLFGSTGLLSVGLSALGAGGLAGVLGLLRKRPGDLTPQEMEQAVAAVKGEVTAKDRQMIEIIKGVQAFLDRTTGTASIELKHALDAAQSADTKQAVASAKAVLS